MLLDHFNLREQPFGVTPDPRFFFPSASHREAMASLLYGVQSQRAFMAMIAQPGMGKTMLLFNLLQQLGSGARTAFLFLTQCDSREFLAYLLIDLGLKVQDYDPIRMHEELKAELLKEARAGRQVVVVIDEAQNLSTSVLETIRLLSDFENPQRKLMQIILAGQPQLAEKIASPELLQLRQRLSIIMQIKPLSREEVATYIARRLQVAGYAGPALFTAEAVGHIAARTRGIPRVINNYCFNSLSIAFATGKRQVDADIVMEVARDLEAIEQVLEEHHTNTVNDACPVDLPVLTPEPAVVISMPTLSATKSAVAAAAAKTAECQISSVTAIEIRPRQANITRPVAQKLTPVRPAPPAVVLPVWLRQVVDLISPGSSRSLQRMANRAQERSRTALGRLGKLLRSMSLNAVAFIHAVRRRLTRTSTSAAGFMRPLLLPRSGDGGILVLNLVHSSEPRLAATTQLSRGNDASPAAGFGGCKVGGTNL